MRVFFSLTVPGRHGAPFLLSFRASVAQNKASFSCHLFTTAVTVFPYVAWQLALSSGSTLTLVPLRLRDELSEAKPRKLGRSYCWGCIHLLPSTPRGFIHAATKPKERKRSVSYLRVGATKGSASCRMRASADRDKQEAVHHNSSCFGK